MAAPNQLPPGVDLSAALSSFLSSKPRPAVQALADVTSSAAAAGGDGQQALVRPDGRNSRRIYCPRAGCGCLILRVGDAEWKEGVKGVYDSAGPFPPSPTGTSATAQPYWHITTSPMGFENIGFSRNLTGDHVLPAGLPSGALKYLICADCDLGPLGWTTDGNSEAWLGVERVGYGPEEST